MSGFYNRGTGPRHTNLQITLGIQSNISPIRLLMRACLCLLAAGVGCGLEGQANRPLIVPSAVAFDASGNLYFAEASGHVVWRLTLEGVVSVVAGTGVQGFAGDGGAGVAALLDTPSALAVDAAGAVYIADSHNHRVRRVDPVSDVIDTVVTTPLPLALAIDGAGRVVYGDGALHQVLRVDAGGSTLLAGDGVQGSGGDGGFASAAMLDLPSGLAFDSHGSLYIADAHSHRVRRVDGASGLITTVTGMGVPGFSGEGSDAVGATLAMPRGLVVDAGGNLFVADSGNHRVRRVDGVTGQITTVAGDGAQGFGANGVTATSGALNSPAGLGLSALGRLTWAERGNQRVRQVDGNQRLLTIAGLGALAAAKAPSVTTLDQVLVTTVTSTVGTPGGTVELMDGASAIAVSVLSGGSATFPNAGLTGGSHTLTSVYAGDSVHLGSVSTPVVVTIGGAAPADFTLTSAAGTSAASLPATFTFLLTPTGAPLVSAITLSVAGLPVGFVASFTPAYLPPPSGPTSFTVTLAPQRAGVGAGWVVMGLLLPLFVVRRMRRVWPSCGLLLLAACGDRTNTSARDAQASKTYAVVISATGTSASGTTLIHTAQVTLTFAQ